MLFRRKPDIDIQKIDPKKDQKKAPKFRPKVSSYEKYLFFFKKQTNSLFAIRN